MKVRWKMVYLSLNEKQIEVTIEKVQQSIRKCTAYYNNQDYTNALKENETYMKKYNTQKEPWTKWKH